jgi:hypothetical protein
MIETVVGAKHLQSIVGGSGDYHIASAPLQTIFDRAIFDWRVSNKKGGPRLLIREKHGTLRQRTVRPSSGSAGPHRRDKFFGSSVLLQPQNALGRFLDQTSQSRHLGLDRRRLRLIP